MPELHVVAFLAQSWRNIVTLRPSPSTRILLTASASTKLKDLKGYPSSQSPPALWEGIHRGMEGAHTEQTLSPTFHFRTLWPTSTTSPQSSCPITVPRSMPTSGVLCTSRKVSHGPQAQVFMIRSETADLHTTHVRPPCPHRRPHGHVDLAKVATRRIECTKHTCVRALCVESVGAK